MANRFTCTVDKGYQSTCKDLPEYKDTRYCVLHFPGEEKEAAFKDAVERKLAKKDHEYYDFAGTVFPKGTSDFKGRVFDADAKFAGATFHGKAAFSKAIFKGKANFQETTFKQKADLSQATFEGEEARFRETIFEGEADFSKAKFEREANFRRATFKSSVEFSAPSEKAYTFNRRANFSRARFEERVTFVGASTFNVEQEKVTFRFALTDKPELCIFDRVRIRPSWFIDKEGCQLFRRPWGMRPGQPRLARSCKIMHVTACYAPCMHHVGAVEPVPSACDA